jgi:hypothetical protein
VYSWAIKELSHRTVSDTRPILFGWFVNLIPFENSKMSLGNCTCVFILSAKGGGDMGREGGGCAVGWVNLKKKIFATLSTCCQLEKIKQLINE